MYVYKPLNVYGESKLKGELAVSGTLEKYFIVRIAWVFGLNGKNFIKTMLNVGQSHDTVRVVYDQIGTPTYTLDLSRLLVDMIETDKYPCRCRGRAFPHSSCPKWRPCRKNAKQRCGPC